MTNSLTEKTSSGFAWLVLQTFGVRGVRMGAQIALAWLLLPEDFGLFGMTMAVAAIAMMPAEGGLQEVLVKRHKRFELWSAPGFWVALAVGLVMSAAMFASAPLVARLFDEPEVIDLIRIAAIAPLIGSLNSVAMAKLNSQMRFRAVAVLGMVKTVVNMGLAVALAALDMGAYSFIIPIPVAQLVHTAGCYALARPQVRLRRAGRRIRYLVRDVGSLYGVLLMRTVGGRVDTASLSIFLVKDRVGLYVFAFNLSMQTMGMVVIQLTNVLLPALSKLDKDPQRQRRAFVRAARTLALVGIPTSLLQCVLADPLVRLIFQPQWLESVAILQILSVGMALRVMAGPSGSLLRAQGRFTALLRYQAVCTPLFALLALAVASTQSAVNVAMAVAGYFSVFAIGQTYLALRAYGRAWGDLGRVFGPACATGFAGAIPAFAASTWLSLHRYSPLFNALVSTVIMLAVCVAVARLVAPDASRELVERLRAFARRGRSAAPATPRAS